MNATILRHHAPSVNRPPAAAHHWPGFGRPVPAPSCCPNRRRLYDAARFLCLLPCAEIDPDTGIRRYEDDIVDVQLLPDAQRVRVRVYPHHELAFSAIAHGRPDAWREGHWQQHVESAAVGAGWRARG